MKVTPLMSTLATASTILAVSTTSAQAVEIYHTSFEFGNIPGDNTVGDPFSRQFRFDVLETEDNSVRLKFINRDDNRVNPRDPNATITDIYFDDGDNVLSGLNIATSLSSVGVEDGYKVSNKTDNFPQGANLNFTTDYAVTTKGNKNGIKPGNTLRVGTELNMDIQADVDTVIESIKAGNLRVGIHVQTFTDGDGSDSFINRTEAIPEPLTIIGTGMALGFGGLFQREYSKKKKKEEVKA